MNILLDMDGVLANFRDAAARVNWLPLDAHLEEWNFHHKAGLTDEQFYANIAADIEFWDKLEPYPWLEQLASVVSYFDPHYHIVSYTNGDGSSAKQRWIKKYLGHERAWMGKGDRSRMAMSGTVLIDDRDKNVSAFRSKCGWAITFPQPWNAAREALPCDRALFVESMLEQLRTIEDAP